MTNGPEHDRPADAAGGPEDAVNDFDHITERLGQGFEGDPRLESGVPQDQRGSDIEFIQMSGLVRPSAPPSASAPPAHDDLDASRPVSFFEKGVADVDADMAPGVTEDPVMDGEDTRPIQQTRTAMSHLRDIIDDLTKDAPAAATDPALMAALDAPEAVPAPEPPPPSMASTELPPAPEEPAPPEAPISLDDILAEFGAAHPMGADAESPEGPRPSPAPAVDIAPVPAATETPRETVSEAPRMTRHAPVLPGHAAQLAEAEKLIDDLEPAPEAEDAAPSVAPGPRRVDADELPDEALDYKRQGKRRHRSAGKSPVLAALARLAAGLVIVSALAVATYAGSLWVKQRMASPDQLFNQASRLAAKGDYAAASQMFEDFAALHPADPLRAEAQFNAAFTMQLQKPADNDAAQEVTRQALRLFEQYCKDNPAHAKTARAQTLMGRLNFESGRYTEAVELLRNPELRLRDPASAVPALRTLARASAKMGDAEAARSYYLQAVGVQGNHSPDVDYAELGSLYQSRADRAEDLDKRIELQQLAIESWTHALEAPGIDPSSKQSIRSQLDVLRERLESEPGMAPAMESLNDAAAAGDASAEPAAPSGEAVPAAETPASAPAAEEAPAAPADTAVPAADTGEYVVKRGDTLTSIADVHRVTLDALKELNALSGDTVLEGQHLLLPAAQ